MSSDRQTIKNLAKIVAESLRISRGSVRAQQMKRTQIIAGETVVDMDTLLTDAVDYIEQSEITAEGVDALSESSDQISDEVESIPVESIAENESLLYEQDELGVDQFDFGYDNDESAHLARMKSIEVNELVDEAQAAADQAVEDAANALTTANGKNARRRGVTEPGPPEGGWVQGDQWVRDVLNEDDEPVPVEVLVWNGTEFVHESTLTGELLVVGENGVVRLADGSVTAANVSADFFYGREFVGGRFEGGEFLGGRFVGGEFIQYAADDFATEYPTVAGDIVQADFLGGTPTEIGTPDVDLSVYVSGDRSLRVTDSAGAGSLLMTWVNTVIPVMSEAARLVRVRFRVSHAVTDMHVTTPGGTTVFGDAAPGVWHVAEVDVPAGDDLAYVHAGVVTGDSATTLWVDVVEVLTESYAGAYMVIGRDHRGRPGVYAKNVDDQVLAEFTPDGLTIFGGSLNVDGIGGAAPIGAILQFAGSTAPAGWMLCDGSTLNIADYPRLYDVIDTTYGGSGDTFNLPDLRTRVPVGMAAGDSNFGALGNTGGAKTHTLTIAQMPSHNHGGSTGSTMPSADFALNNASSNPSGDARIVRAGTADQATRNIQSSSHSHSISSQGGGGAHNNLQPYITLHYIIRTGA